MNSSNQHGCASNGRSGAGLHSKLLMQMFYAASMFWASVIFLGSNMGNSNCKKKSNETTISCRAWFCGLCYQGHVDHVRDLIKEALSIWVTVPTPVLNPNDIIIFCGDDKGHHYSKWNQRFSRYQISAAVT